VLFNHCQKRETDRFRAEAALHGAKIDAPITEVKNKENTFVFKDPDEYKNLSDEEKKRLTKEMKEAHKIWSSNKKQIGKIDG